MDDERIDVDAIGSLTLLHLGPNVQEIRIRADEHYDHVEMVLCLADDTWPNRETVIEEMVDLRDYLFDEVSLEYTFADAVTGSAFSGGPYVRERERVFAR